MARILDTIDDPTQLRTLSQAELTQLAQEIRHEIIETVSLRGGHLAPNLGAVELTLALHIAFDTPHDQLVWDIGHQAYPHKLVTGRRDRFRTIKQFQGISGYLRREESEYDVFGASHASTSISAALGIAAARDLRGEKTKVVAVIGDGALTGGMALEAINNAGALKKDFIIVLNDNDKSISDNVGALHNYLGQIRTDKRYRRLRELASHSLDHVPGGGLAKEMAGRAERSAKEFVLPSRSGVIFEELGFTFLGPFDGHNIDGLISVFEKAREMEGPILIQVITQKGRGCDFAEAEPTKFHGPGAYDPATGEMKKKPGEPPKYQDVFADALVELARQDPTIVGITAAMGEGTSLNKLQKALPERYFDVGIAEQHAVTFAAGLAVGGMRPVAAIYSTFMQRAFDQIIHDVCVQNLHVVFPMDRAGLVGEDGHTQQGAFDIAFMRMIPNMRVMAPKDEHELRNMLYTALYMDGPVSLRYPRGSGVGVPLDEGFTALPIGKAELLTPEKEIAGAQVAILGIGSTVAAVEQAARELHEENGIRAVAVNARWVKPLDEELILRLARETGHLVTIEEASAMGGFGSAVAELLHAHDLHDVKLKIIGLPDRFIEHGAPAILRELTGISSGHIKEVARDLLADEARDQEPNRAPKSSARRTNKVEQEIG
ncbi:MAG TPA: 1-deoxy-D-xylulose-5-phosphate synthase [Ktedonobacterales bacterium]|nr:1-deoxy-D-xylulose-5-phosphate synthase [Ktedonobacterales bacterium]